MNSSRPNSQLPKTDRHPEECRGAGTVLRLAETIAHTLAPDRSQPFAAGAGRRGWHRTPTLWTDL
jgi:hypothetical protein